MVLMTSLRHGSLARYVALRSLYPAKTSHGRMSALAHRVHSASADLVTPWTRIAVLRHWQLARDCVHRVAQGRRHCHHAHLLCAATRTMLAASHASSALTADTVWRFLRKWMRILLHLWKLLTLASPLMLSAPAVLAVHEAMPAVNDAWWNYASWAARNSTSPALIKFLQWASTRRDIFPPSFCDRFQSLHETAPVHSWAETEDTLVAAFGPAWRDLLDIDHHPIGSGCIAQVYRGRLRATGEDVAVKIIHPQVKKMIAVDLELMRLGVRLLESFPPLQYLSGRESVQQFAQLMNRQLDLRVEAESLQRFADHFRDRAGIHFPEPYMELTSDSVLIESYENGLHFHQMLREFDTKERKRIARVVLESYLRMVFLDNFAHGDLHPGNLLFRLAHAEKAGSSKSTTAQVVALDAGIVTRLEPSDLKNFVDLFHAVATGEGYKAGQLIVEHSQPSERVLPNGERIEVKCTDVESFCKGVERIVDEALRWNLRLHEVHVGKLLRDVMELCCVHEVKLEGKYASIVISIAVLEAVGRQLDPDLDILSVALPIIVQSQMQRVWQRSSIPFKR